MKKILVVVLVVMIGGIMLGTWMVFGAEKEEEAEQPARPKVEIGQPLPDFTMKDYNGNEHTLSALKGKAVVLVLTSQECPFSRDGDPRLAKVAEQYKDQPVVFLSIDSHFQTPVEEIKKYATETNQTGKLLPYPILKDEGSEYARKVQGKRTPEVYIVNADQKLVYQGGLDNELKPEDPDYVNYVAKALEEVLAGQEVSTPRTRVYGCTIKFGP